MVRTNNIALFMQPCIAIASGVLYALAFPKFDFWWCAFFWPLPLYVSILKSVSWKQAFLLGWCAGWTAFLIILYWVPVTISAGGGHWALALLGWVLLAVYLGVYIGFFAVFIKPWLEPTKLISKLAFPFLAASLWVLTEWLRSHFLGGFPWCLLGYSLTNSPALMQWAEGGSIWILSAIPMLISGCIWAGKRAWGAGAVVLLLGIFLLAGHIRMRHLEKMLVPGLKIAVLQGNIAQYEKWDASRAQAITEVYRKLIRDADKEAPDLVVWPEAAWPFLRQDGETGRRGEGERDRVRVSAQESIEEFLKQEASVHLVGVITQEEEKFYNSGLLLNGKQILGRYDKAHLVPFGEFVPLGWLLAPWIDVLNQVGGISPGPAHAPVELPGGGKMGVTICYEAIFPGIARALARQGATFLVNLTNDGWYLDTAAPYQHFQMNLVRAVENRLPLVRSANTGISAFVTPLGIIAKSTRLNEAKAACIPIMTLRSEGFFSSNRHNMQSVFLAGCLALALFAMIKPFLK